MSLEDGLILSMVYSKTGADNLTAIDLYSGSEYYNPNYSGLNLLEDNLLGPTLQFTGSSSFIEISHPNFQLSDDFTIGGWFKFYDAANWVRLIGKGVYGAGTESIGLWANPLTDTWWASQQGTTPPAIVQSRTKPIDLNQWQHITVVRQGDAFILYHNMEEHGRISGLTGNPQADSLPLRIGYHGEHEGFNGEMTRLHIYNRALSGAEVQQLITSSGVSMLIDAVTSRPITPLENLPGGDFIKTHPIEFALFDQNNHYALYIDDNPLGQPLEFEVHNISERDIEFRLGDGETASESNFHFELQFRKGVLSANTLKRLEAAQLTDGVIEGSDSWDLYLSSSGDHISLYLLHTGETTWAANTRRRLRFAGINADAIGGARGTRVVMLPNQLSFAGSDAPITGKRTQHLSIINHQGQKELPLHVGFKGSNQVLNINGAETTLTLQLVNIVRRAQTHTDVPAISLRAPSDDRSASRFILEVDVEEEGEEKAWALARASELALSITAVVKRRGQTAADSGARFTVIPNTQAISPQWVIMPQQDMSLDAGDTLELTIADIRSSLPTGPANLYLHYDHIAGYQDGRFVLPVIKSPLFFADGNVSIGRADPTAKLKIEAGSGLALRVEPDPGQAVYIGRSTQNSLEFNYASGQAINSTASLSFNIDTKPTDARHVRYIDFRANGEGFSAGQRLMQIMDGGQVAIGTQTWAVPNYKMAPGSLTLGNIHQNYGGGTLWNDGNTAGLLLECGANTEIAVHDAGTRVVSLMYYEGDNVNQITIGRDMGWGVTGVHIAGSLVAGSLAVEGPISKKFRRWWTLENPDWDHDWGNTRIGLISPAQWTNSDARLKTDIQAIDSPLDKLAQLRGVTYSWSDEGLRYLTAEIDSVIFAGPEATEEENAEARRDARREAYELLARREVGLLAQDVEEAMPQLVRQDADGYKKIRYDLLVTLLVEAVKEQQKAIRDLAEKLSLLTSFSK